MAMPDKTRRVQGEIWPIAMRWPLLLLSLLLYIEPVTAMEPVDMVYPPLDSANSRWFYFDSESLPFGMVNLSPDTEVEGASGSKLGPSEMINGRAELVRRREISGYVDNGATFRRPKPTRVFFHAVLDQDVTAFSGWRGGAMQENPLVSWVEGRDAGAVINLGQAVGKSQVHMKVAISTTPIRFGVRSGPFRPCGRWLTQRERVILFVLFSTTTKTVGCFRVDLQAATTPM